MKNYVFYGAFLCSVDDVADTILMGEGLDEDDPQIFFRFSTETFHFITGKCIQIRKIFYSCTM